MATISPSAATAAPTPDAGKTVLGIIVAISACHLINDMMQSLLPAIYPGLAKELSLSFGQIGLITLVYQITASILQPIIGLVADRKPAPLALPIGTLFSMAGLTVLSVAHVYGLVLLGAALLGMGSSIFHPESSRVARMASGSRPGFAQSLFQVGGNAGSALGPLAAALVVVRWGQTSLAFFALLSLLSAAILWNVSRWYKHHGLARLQAGKKARKAAPLPAGKARLGIAVLLGLVFSKYIYLASLTSFYTFYLIEKFHLSVAQAQFQLFLFLAAVAAGTVAGGPLGDRFGRTYVLWFSILGALPFALLLPHASLAWTTPLAMVIGLILASAFPAIIVFAQELMPDHVGTVSGLFFGFAFGVGGIGAAALGWAADKVGIETVYHWVAFMPALGLLCLFLPKMDQRIEHTAEL